MNSQQLVFIFLLFSGCMTYADPALRGLPRGLYTITEDRPIVVRGTSLQEIAQSLQQTKANLQGSGEIGFSDYAFDWDLQPEQEMGTCQASQVKIQLSLVFNRPAWADRNKASEAVRSTWDVYLRQVVQHEEGHRAITLAMGKEMIRRLNRLRESSCRALVDRANRVVQEIHDDFSAKHHSYDHAYPPMIWPPGG